MSEVIVAMTERARTHWAEHDLENPVIIPAIGSLAILASHTAYELPQDQTNILIRNREWGDKRNNSLIVGSSDGAAIGSEFDPQDTHLEISLPLDQPPSEALLQEWLIRELLLNPQNTLRQKYKKMFQKVQLGSLGIFGAGMGEAALTTALNTSKVYPLAGLVIGVAATPAAALSPLIGQGVTAWQNRQTRQEIMDDPSIEPALQIQY